MDLFVIVPALVGSAAIRVLLAAAGKKIILGAAIIAFSAVGLGMTLGSAALTGWWQAALLGFGPSLLILGTVQLGILGVINKLIEQSDDSKPKVSLFFPNVTTSEQQCAVLLRELAASLDSSTDSAEARQSAINLPIPPAQP